MNFSYLDIQRLKVFFQALKDGGFKSNLNQIPSSIRTDCFTLLRKLPQFQTEEFKDDNNLMRALNEYLRDPNKRKAFLSKAEFTQQQQAEFTQVLEEPVVVEAVGEQSGGQAAPAGQAAGEPAGTMTGGGGLPQMPNFSSPYTRSAPRIIRKAPPNTPPAPEPGATTSSSSQATVKTTTITPAPSAKPGSATVTSSSGFTPSATGYQSPKVPQSFKMPYSFTNATKNFSSAAQRFTKTNLGRIGGGLGQIAGGVGRGVGGPMLNGIYNGSRKAVNGGFDAFGRLNTGFRGTSKSLASSGSKKLLWGLVGGFVLFFGVSLIGGITGTTPSGQAASVSSTGINGLNYTLPIKDPSVNPLDIRDQIKADFPSAKLDYWDTIINTSKAAGINPALTLALWIEETGASQTTVIRNGGAGIPTASGDLTLGHLGCAPTEDQTINESLNCLIKFINNNNFTNNDFPQFMAKYSGGPVSDPFSNNVNFPGNFKKVYSGLVPSGPGAIQIIAPSVSYTPNGGSGVISCPLNGVPTITNGSIAADGHCSPSYEKSYGVCIKPGSSGYTGKDTAIDVVSKDHTVYLPTITSDPKTQWTVDEAGNVPISEGEGGGISVAANTTISSGVTYRIRFVHISSTNLKIGDQVNQGTPVGEYYPANPFGAHVHITVQENGVFKPADLYFNLCR